jgi:hypothetical protein
VRIRFLLRISNLLSRLVGGQVGDLPY